jgi:hypothetical protein
MKSRANIVFLSNIFEEDSREATRGVDWPQGGSTRRKMGGKEKDPRSMEAKMGISAPYELGSNQTTSREGSLETT